MGLVAGGEEQGQGRETREWGEGRAISQGSSETLGQRLPESQNRQGLDPGRILE